MKVCCSLSGENKEMGKGKGENGVMEKHNQKGGWYGKEGGDILIPIITTASFEQRAYPLAEFTS